MHAHEVHAHEILAYKMHIREMYTCEIYAHCSVTLLGINTRTSDKFPDLEATAR
jgi:hypothetical protein